MLNRATLTGRYIFAIGMMSAIAPAGEASEVKHEG